jgi:RNA polymerase sigma factor (sigma-70 family)
MIRAINFLAKPPYEPGDKPRFDTGRFNTTTSVSTTTRSFQDGSLPELTMVRGASGAMLSATWQGGNKAEPSAKVTRPAKSYEDLVRAAEKPILRHVSWQDYWKLVPARDWGDYKQFLFDRYKSRWPQVSQSYGDIRRHGKIKKAQDITYAQAAHREAEAFLHREIDKAAPARRQQIIRQRVTRLWQQERCRHQSRRLLYLLKQPQTPLEARFLMHALGWLLRQKETIRPGYDLSADKSVNCVSAEARVRSWVNDQRTPERQRHVFPTATEELALARAGDARARDRLLAVHWPLVYGIAKKYVTAAHPIDELIQEGFIGLTKCFEQFDPEAGFRFSTFAMCPIEWAILDYKRREHKKDMVPLEGAMIEHLVDLGSPFESGLTSRNNAIRKSVITRQSVITAHISPYKNGLAPETRDFVAWLNAEACEEGIDVKFAGLANRIEASGDIEAAANSDTLLGWFLNQARSVGFFEGEEAVLKRGNSQWRKHLRKLAKRKYR